MSEQWQHRLEVLALLLCLVVAAFLVGLAAQVVLHANDQPTFALEATAYSWRRAALQIDLGEAFALLAAYLVVTLGPGDEIGRVGRLALWLVLVLGLLVAVIGAYDVVLTLTDGNLGYQSIGRTGWGWTTHYAGTTVVAGFVAWCAYQALGELMVPLPPFPEAGGGDGVGDGVDQGGDEAVADGVPDA